MTGSPDRWARLLAGGLLALVILTGAILLWRMAAERCRTCGSDAQCAHYCGGDGKP